MGQTLGLLGFGHIGQEVARLARAFGMPVLVWSRRFSENDAARDTAAESFDIEIVPSAEDLVEQSDVISVHLALTKDTRGFVNGALLSSRQAGRLSSSTPLAPRWSITRRWPRR